MNKLNKKGFTLVELLAVIVILGVIMLIAIPSIGTIISNSRENSFLSSGKMYISSAQNYVASGDIVVSSGETKNVDIKEVNNGKYDKSPIDSKYSIIGSVSITIDDKGNATYTAKICESADQKNCASNGKMVVNMNNESDRKDDIIKPFNSTTWGE